MVEWIKTRIDVFITKDELGGTKWMNVKAARYGNWGVHKGIGDQIKKYMVTHTPTGMYVAEFQTKDFALRFVASLSRKFPDVVLSTTKEEVAVYQERIKKLRRRLLEKEGDEIR